MAELNANFSLEQRQIRANFSLEQTTIPAIFKINAAGTTWGSISGNIQNQEDLYLILQDKASVESVETLAETVQNNYDTLDTKIDNTESALAGQITALSNTVNINNQNINNRVDTVEETVSNLTDTVSDNYTELDGKISDNTDAISTINDTISGYGNIVTHNVNEFATAAQGALADSALQSGDNISELVNNVGYITSASLPTVNNGTLTIQRNGSQVAVFTANDAQNITANILVPTQASDIGALPDTTTIADLTTQVQLNAINSGATATNIGQITTNQNAIADIRDLIPIQATSSNQLADKAFVNSSIATNTAYFIGTFNSVAELEAYSGPLTNNDYAFVATTDAAGNTLYDRYKYNADTQQWIFEYELNNSSFTAAQWAAINSGITSGDVSLIQSALQPNDNVSELANDAGYITSASLPTVNNGILDIQVNGTSIGTFTANQAGNTTANIVVPDSATWGNISGTLSNQTDLQNALDAKYDASNPNGYTSNVGTVTSVNNVSPVGGNVTLSIPSDTSDLTNGAGFITSSALSGYATETWVGNQGYITGITSLDVTTALGYTPLSNSTKYGADLSYSSNTLQLLDQDGNSLGNSVIVDALPSQTEQSGKYLTTDGSSASWGSITIPTVNDATLTINQGGTLKGTFTANASSDVSINLDGNQRNIGEIVTSTIPLTDAGLHLLDGALINGSGIYADFVTYIAGLVTDYPDLFETEENWQSAVTTYGVCGKFVYDSVNNTVRLPKITGILEGTTDANALGDLVEAGLPNITGTFAGNRFGIGGGTYGSMHTGAFLAGTNYSTSGWYGAGPDTGIGYNTMQLNFDASGSSSIYGNSSTVQPQTIKVLYYIVIATTTKTEIEVDIDEIATDLNGKADVDLTNCTNVANIKMAHNAMPSNSYVNLTLGASGTTYTAPADGWFYLQKFYGGSNLFTQLTNTTNNTAVNNTFHSTSSFYCCLMLPVKKGDIVQASYNTTGAVQAFKFFYAQGSESEAQ